MMAYLLMPQQSWLKKMIAIHLLIAVSSRGLNSIFILLNNSLTTPLVLCADPFDVPGYSSGYGQRGIDYLRGVKWTAGITVGMVLAVGL